MGQRLFESDRVFRAWMQRFDAAATRQLGVSIVEELYGARARSNLEQTRISHAAIFMIEYALAQALINAGVIPDLVLGASLGEVTAAVVAGMLDPDQALQFVIEQASVFDERCPPGAMLVVLDSPESHAAAIGRDCEIAAITGPRHFTMSGARTAISKYAVHLKARDIVAEILTVPHGFHSSLIEPAKESFLRLASALTVEPPRIPFMSCARAAVVQTINPEHLWAVVRQPVRASETTQELLKRGDRLYVDSGPSGTMANLVTQNAAAARENPTSLFVLHPHGDDTARFRAVVDAARSVCTDMKERPVNKTAYLFPGQGSQFKGMGRGLFDQFPTLTSKADTILGYSIRDLCIDDPQGRLSSTEYTQPAIYVVDVLTYLQRASEGWTLPDYLAGHSLGEYAALWAAGVFDFETGLRLVQKRGALMRAASGGGMAAILGVNHQAVASVIDSNGFSGLDIANLNAPDQTVVAGPGDLLLEAQPAFERTGAMVVPLNVSAPFHSRYMEAAARQFAAFLNGIDFRAPKVPVIANVTARPYPAAPSEIRAALAQQMTATVRWSETIAYLMRNAVDNDFIEIGPGDVLTRLVQSIRRAGIPRDVPIEPSKAATAVSTHTSPRAVRPRIAAETLGASSFRDAYRVKHAYVAGSMYMGIASKQLVIRMARAGYLGFFGTGGLELDEIDTTIRAIKAELRSGEPFGMNLLCDPVNPHFELETVRLFHAHDVRCVEASGFMQITPALVVYRVKGLSVLPSGEIASRRRIIAKVSHPDVARAFLEPSPAVLLDRLLGDGEITPVEAELGRQVPLATDLCVEADSGGHTDRAVTTTILPTIARLRDRVCAANGYSTLVHVGSAGGIGTPEAAAASFLLGADFILTGSINQCTSEAGTSDLVKDMLQKINVQDTDYAPAADMFEMGSKVRVMKRGVFFPARANKLYELWRSHASLDEIDRKEAAVIQEKYFKRSFDEVYSAVRHHYQKKSPGVIAMADSNAKYKMALIFKSYFANGTRWALEGCEEHRVNFQVQCGPAMGAFNQWVAGSPLEAWRHRHVDDLAERMMLGAADVLNTHFDRFHAVPFAPPAQSARI